MADTAIAGGRVGFVPALIARIAAAYAEMGRNQEAEGERVIVMRLAPFFDTPTFAGQKKLATICWKD